MGLSFDAGHGSGGDGVGEGFGGKKKGRVVVEEVGLVVLVVGETKVDGAARLQKVGSETVSPSGQT
jgi:hypothetical protein